MKKHFSSFLVLLKNELSTFAFERNKLCSSFCEYEFTKYCTSQPLMPMLTHSFPSLYQELVEKKECAKWGRIEKEHYHVTTTSNSISFACEKCFPYCDIGMRESQATSACGIPSGGFDLIKYV